MRAVLALIMFVSLTAPAFAQDNHVPRYGEADKEKTNSQKAADKAATEAYQRSLGNIPEKGASDPWGAARSTDAPMPSCVHPPASRSSPRRRISSRKPARSIT